MSDSEIKTAWYTAPAEFRIPAEWGLSDEGRDSLRDDLWNMVLTGEDDADAYIETIEMELEEVDTEVAEEDLERFVEGFLDARRAQQAALGGAPVTPLTRAFAELETIGVLGRENFTCCGTCGAAEIWDERDDSREWRGYLFFHQQDAERIPEDRETYVGYGAFLDAFLPETEWEALSEEQKDRRYTDIVTGLMVGEVFPILEKHGVSASWDGDLGTRILLSDIDFYAEV